jgi:hypothetical protein|tara:strand:+ start:260 stop:526 length:267 start_codon:yes stop_codon:yes gene_type:complete
MQDVDVTNFTNSSGWHVSHNPNTLQYEIKAESNGKLRPGSWTHRRFADKALHDYLAHIQKTSPNELKKAKKAKPPELTKKEIMEDVYS